MFITCLMLRKHVDLMSNVDEGYIMIECDVPSLGLFLRRTKWE